MTSPALSGSYRSYFCSEKSRVLTRRELSTEGKNSRWDGYHRNSTLLLELFSNNSPDTAFRCTTKRLFGLLMNVIAFRVLGRKGGKGNKRNNGEEK